MPITTAQYKAAVEAKIAAATGATSLDDLTLIKSNADLWLRNNSSGTIAGYAALEALIQAKQDTLTGGSTLDDISLAGMAALPPVVGKTLVWKTQPFLTSGTFTRPAKMAGDIAWVTASAGGGGGTSYSAFSVVRGACGGSWCKDRPVNVPVGSSHTVVIGSGGTAGNSGGNTTFGTQLVLRGGGPAIATSASDGVTLQNAATSSTFTYIANVVGVHPGWTCFVAPFDITDSNHKPSVLHVPPESVNGFVGAGLFFSNPEGRFTGAGPAAGYYGAPAASYNDATPINTGCGGWSANGQTGRSGSAGRLDIGWWEYE